MPGARTVPVCAFPVEPARHPLLAGVGGGRRGRRGQRGRYRTVPWCHALPVQVSLLGLLSWLSTLLTLRRWLHLRWAASSCHREARTNSLFVIPRNRQQPQNASLAPR
jgi:hypothetical protein